ncbi:MAG: hypothetical protein LC745_12690, partial [Planctomycetia bacterium]|nr:hypothetical protein [Planctomycetia bacterium]
YIRADFDLRGAAPGQRNLSVTFSDGTTLTLPNAFTVEAGGDPNVWADVLGRASVRAGQSQRYTILYGNRGNVDAIATPLTIGIPSGSTLTFDTGLQEPDPLPGQSPIDWSQVPVYTDDGTTKIYPLLLPFVPVGQVGTIRATVTFTGPGPYHVFTQTHESLNQSGTIANLDALHPETVRDLIHNCTELPPDKIDDAVRQECAESATNLIFVGEWLKCFTNPFQFAADKTGVNLKDVSDPNIVPKGVGNLFFEYLSPLFEFRKRFVGRVGGELPVVPQKHVLDESVEDALKKAGKVSPAFKKVDEGVDGFEKKVELARNTSEGINDCVTVFRIFNHRDFYITRILSHDPNEKDGSLGSGAAHFVTGAEPLRYLVSFENTPTASAPAQEVVVTDQLDTTHDDLSTFSLGPISFGSSVVVPPTGLSDYTTDVDLRPAK